MTFACARGIQQVLPTNLSSPFQRDLKILTILFMTLERASRKEDSDDCSANRCHRFAASGIKALYSVIGSILCERAAYMGRGSMQDDITIK